MPNFTKMCNDNKPLTYKLDLNHEKFSINIILTIYILYPAKLFGLQCFTSIR